MIEEDGRLKRLFPGIYIRGDLNRGYMGGDLGQGG